jgi:hypothetical protein
LADADGPGFLALNGSFQAENQSLIGHHRSFVPIICRQQSGRLQHPADPRGIDPQWV